MSQYFVNVDESGTTNVQTLTGNSGGPISPLAGNINIVGDDVNVTVSGNESTHTLTITLENQTSDEVTTTDNTPTTLFAFSPVTANSTLSFTAVVAGNGNGTVDAIGGNLTGVFKVNGAGTVSLLVGSNVINQYMTSGFATASFSLVVVANVPVIQVVGVDANTIDWFAVVTYANIS